MPPLLHKRKLRWRLRVYSTTNFNSTVEIFANWSLMSLSRKGWFLRFSWRQQYLWLTLQSPNAAVSSCGLCWELSNPSLVWFLENVVCIITVNQLMTCDSPTQKLYPWEGTSMIIFLPVPALPVFIKQRRFFIHPGQRSCIIPGTGHTTVTAVFWEHDDASLKNIWKDPGLW